MSKKQQTENNLTATEKQPAKPTSQIELEKPSYRGWFDVVIRIATLIAFAVAIWLTTRNLDLITRNLALINQQLDDKNNRETEHLFWVISRERTSPKARTEAFKKLIAAENTEWRIANLNKLDLREMDFIDLNIKDAVFEDCDFRKAQFESSTLTKSKFMNCKMSEANFQTANLADCYVFKSNLDKANLQLAQFPKAVLEQSKIRNANLRGCDFSEAKLPMCDLTDSDLSAATFTRADLQNAKLIRANLQLTLLPADPRALRGVDFTNSNWWRARYLPPKVIIECRKKYVPTENAPKGYQEDYEDWLKNEGAIP